MNKRTKKLLSLMDEYGLDDKDVGKLLGRTASTVVIWRCANEDRIIPVSLLKLLELVLASKKTKAAEQAA